MIATARANWFRVLVSGSALYALVTAAALDTHNINLVPLVLVFGAALIPVTFVVWAFESLAASTTAVPALTVCFAAGGSFGVAAASVFEYQTLRELGTLPMVAVGLIEETVKLVVPLYLLVRWRFRAPTDGVLFGVAAGMGFAVMETMGYGLVALMQSGGRIGPAEEVLLLRGVLAPVGHAAWTGLVAAALWGVRAHARNARRWIVLAGTFILAVALHGLWDATDSTGIRVGIGLLSGTLLAARIGRLRRSASPREAASGDRRQRVRRLVRGGGSLPVVPTVLGEWLRFATVGATNTLLSWCAYALLVAAGLHYLLASSLAFGLGVANSYSLNRRWTFRSHARRAPELLRFAIVQGVGLVADLGLLYAMVDGLGVHHLIAQALVFPAASTLTFALSRSWAFRRRETVGQARPRPPVTRNANSGWGP